MNRVLHTSQLVLRTLVILHLLLKVVLVSVVRVFIAFKDSTCAVSNAAYQMTGRQIPACSVHNFSHPRHKGN